MINPPSCLVGNLPNNLDIDLNEVMKPNMLGDLPSNGTDMNPAALANASGQVDMSQFQGVLQGQPGIVPTQNQLTREQAQVSLKQQTWIQWFHELEGHDFLLPIDPRFLKDSFNLVQLGELNLSKARLSQCKALMNRKMAPTSEELQNE